MALKIINITKDRGKLLNQVVKDVFIQTLDNYYSGDTKYNDLKNFGHIGESGLKITAEPIEQELLSGDVISKGLDVTVEITPLQFFNMFEFEKFNNEKVIVYIPDVELYIVNFVALFSADVTFNKQGDSKIMIKGKKRVQQLVEMVTPNPWQGTWPTVWQAGTPSPVDIPDKRVYRSSKTGSASGDQIYGAINLD